MFTEVTRYSHLGGRTSADRLLPPQKFGFRCHHKQSLRLKILKKFMGDHAPRDSLLVNTMISLAIENPAQNTLSITCPPDSAIVAFAPPLNYYFIVALP